MQIRQLDPCNADVNSSKLFFELLSKLFDMSEWSVLDAFARNGAITVSQYVGSVQKLDCWELSEEHRQALEKYVLWSTGSVRIGCSYGHIKECTDTYNMVVVDTPQGLHKDAEGVIHVEHFDFLRLAIPRVVAGGLIVLYVNKHPYNKLEVGSYGYDEYEEYDFRKWQEARRQFYGCPCVMEEVAIDTYREVIEGCGRRLEQVVIVPCFSDVPGLEPYAFRLALKIL